MDVLFSLVSFLFIFIIASTIIYFVVGRKRVWGKFPMYPDEKILYEENGIKITTSLRGKMRDKIFFNSGFKISNKRIFIMSGKNFVLQTIEFENPGTDEIMQSKFHIAKKDFKFETDKEGKPLLKIEKPMGSMYAYSLEMPVKDIDAVKRALN